MFRKLTLTLAAVLFIGSVVPIWAQPGGPHRPSRPRSPDRGLVMPGHHIPRVPFGAVSIGFKGVRFYFHTGFFYKWQHDGYVIATPPIGIVVPVLPVGCGVEIIDSETYYVLHGTYYRRIPGGYVVVRNPGDTVIVKTVTPTVVSSQECTVWIRNGNGSKTPVKLISAEGGQWVGPKGEYYPEFPTEEQLKPVYGLPGNVEAIAVESPTRQTLWIANTNGSKTPVELEKQEDGSWKGPNGEIYSSLPTETELRSIYGLQTE